MVVQYKVFCLPTQSIFDFIFHIKQVWYLRAKRKCDRVKLINCAWPYPQTQILILSMVKYLVSKIDSNHESKSSRLLFLTLGNTWQAVSCNLASTEACCHTDCQLSCQSSSDRLVSLSKYGFMVERLTAVQINLQFFF